MKDFILDDHEQETRTALMLAALGNEHRLRIYRLLVRAGHSGLNVGDINKKLGIPSSTLSHHITTLRNAGLIEQSRNGRETLTCANYATMEKLIGYLTEKCCVDEVIKESS